MSELVKEDIEAGDGAVVTVVVLGQDEVTVANVGDAEAFLYSRNEDGTIDRIKCTTACNAHILRQITQINGSAKTLEALSRAHWNYL